MSKTLHGLGVSNVNIDGDLDYSPLDDARVGRRYRRYIDTISGVPSAPKRQDNNAISKSDNGPGGENTESGKCAGKSSITKPLTGSFAKILEAGEREARLRLEGHDTTYSLGAGTSADRLREVCGFSDDAGRHGGSGINVIREGKQVGDGITGSGREVGEDGQGYVGAGGEDSYLSRADEFEAIARRESPFDSTGRVRGEVCESHGARACVECSECSEGVGDEVRSDSGDKSRDITRRIVRDTGKLKKSLERIVQALEEIPLKV
jgi:hypothetical protein